MQRLPLFPLGTVLVPGEVLPLHVFEPRYLDLVRDVLAGRDGSGADTSGRFGVVAIRQGHEVGAARLGALYDVGCAAEVLEVDQQDDGSLDLVTVGRERFRLDQLDSGAGTRYLTGLVEWIDETTGPVAPDLAEAVRQAFAEYCSRLGLRAEPGTGTSAGAQALDDPLLLSYVVTGSMLLHLPERQALLAAPDAARRLRRALGLLRRESTIWQVAPSVPAVDLARLPADPR